ncbi:MAG: hypothetical protein FVQ81_02730 [Candidatus Glassbacteria bacterium]|nr:hypothetical protein [Candidatus Glassbacteria bacterium]
MARFLTVLIFVAVASSANAAVDIWVHPWLAPMEKAAVRPSAVPEIIALAVTPGEYEPGAFAVRSDRNATLAVWLVPGRGPGGIPPDWCELHVVESLADSTEPNRLYAFSLPVDVVKDQTRYFWLTVRPPAGTPAGTYRASVRVSADGFEQSVKIACTVLPFELRPAKVASGAFMAGTNLPESYYRDMKEHGLDAIQFFWGGTGVEISNVDGEIVLDFSRTERFMRRVAAAGLKGPVTFSLGNDHSLHYERRIAEAFGFEVITEEKVGNKAVIGPRVTPELDSLFVEGLRQIRDWWEEMAWPQELVILIYDEPTERLLARCKQRYDLLKSVMPGTRVYGVVMNRRTWAESMVDQCDIVVSNGDFLGCLEVTQNYDLGYWVYSFPLRAVHVSRHDMGFLPWRVRAEGAFFWMYNYWNYDPDNCAVYRDPVNPGLPVRSTPWEAIREGHDDLRYAATAEWLIGRAPTGLKQKAQRRLEEIRMSVVPNRRRRAPRGEFHDEMSVLAHYSEPQRVREELIHLIMELLGEGYPGDKEKNWEL